MNSFTQFYEHSKPQRLAARVMLLLTALFLCVSNQIVLLPDLPNWYDQQRFLALLVLAVGLFFYALRPLYPTSPWATGLMLGAVILSLISPLPGWAFAESALFMGLVILAAWINSALRPIQMQRPKLILYCLIIYTMLISLPPLMQYLLAINHHQEFHLASLFRGFSNHRFFSQVESVLIPLAALPAITLSEASHWRRLGNVAACLLWLLAFAAGTRAFYVAIMSSTIFALFAYDQTGKVWCRWQIRFALIGWSGYVLLFMLAPKLLSFSISSDNARLNTLEGGLNSSGRLEMWIASFMLILEHPLTGIGPMHFATLTQSASTQGFAAHPHNVIIQLLVEWGLPFGIAAIATITTFTVRFWQKLVQNSTTRTKSTEISVIAISLITALIYSLFDGTVVTPYTQILLALFIGLTWSLSKEEFKTRQEVHRNFIVRLNTFLTRILCMMSGVFLIWLATTPLNALTPHVENYATSQRGQALWPRFWSQGLINLPIDDRYLLPGWFVDESPLKKTP